MPLGSVDGNQRCCTSSYIRFVFQFDPHNDRPPKFGTLHFVSPLSRGHVDEKSELANFVLDRVIMCVAPIRQPQVRKG